MIADIAAGGDRRATLVAVRDRLAADLDATASARDVAALSLRLTDVLTQIEEIDRADAAAEADAAPKEKTGLSEFERKLRARTADPADPRPAAL